MWPIGRTLVTKDVDVSRLTLFNQPTVYRIIIDEIISSIKQELEAPGVAEDVLIQLQHVREHFYVRPMDQLHWSSPRYGVGSRLGRTWEDRVIASRVVDFESPKPAPRIPPRLATMTPQYKYVPVTHPLSEHTAQAKSTYMDDPMSDTGRAPILPQVDGPSHSPNSTTLCTSTTGQRTSHSESLPAPQPRTSSFTASS
ncbi:hypothetical protein B0H11DRAFT_1925711 [Mycena galericulata]|nr:hypothetical protein B0H11DRAFT_1925711 [Mycena galericulata]